MLGGEGCKEPSLPLTSTTEPWKNLQKLLLNYVFSSDSNHQTSSSNKVVHIKCDCTLSVVT